jgi:predicted nuclease of restriction endonuclease-like RecB superfamily
MLPLDLVRARMVKGAVRPQYLDPNDPERLAMASELIALFESHVGRTRGEIDDAIADRVGEATDFVLQRGLARLLAARGEFEVDAPCDPVELRRRVFERAADAHPVALEAGDRVHTTTRTDVLVAVAKELGIDVGAAERTLFADLERAHVLRRFETLRPDALLHRYNVSLAQAVLLRASRLVIDIAPGDPARYRQLFRYIKFYRLMHAVAGDGTRGYRITLDGPLSLFQLSGKYGLQMAEFLPALLLCTGWTLRADVVWGKSRKPSTFVLGPGNGLRSHYPDRGVYVTDEEKFFVDRFAKTETPWQLERKPVIVDLDGRGVLIPDFVLRHAIDGREALLEIVGFWRKGYLAARIEALRAAAPPNLILAVSTRLKSSDEEPGELPGEVVFFRDVIPVREVLASAERVGMVVESQRVSKP